MKTIRQPLQSAKDLTTAPRQDISIAATTFLLIFLSAGTIPVIGDVLLTTQFEIKVRQLFKNTEMVMQKPFPFAKLEDLPIPVKNYLNTF